MNRNRLKSEFEARERAMQLHHELVNEALQQSMGSPDTMSPEDVKAAIFSLWSIVQFQDQLLTLAYEQMSATPKKPWYKRIFLI